MYDTKYKSSPRGCPYKKMFWFYEADLQGSMKCEFSKLQDTFLELKITSQNKHVIKTIKTYLNKVACCMGLCGLTEQCIIYAKKSTFCN